MPKHSNEDPDDIDRLFARMERVAVAPEFTERVLARAGARQRLSLAWPWLVAGLAAMAILGMSGYLSGVTLADSDGLDVLEALLGDYGLLTTAPGDVLAALGEIIPWRLVALAGVSAALMVWAAGRIIARTPTMEGAHSQA